MFSLRIAARHKIGAQCISTLPRPFLLFLLTPKIEKKPIKLKCTLLLAACTRVGQQ
jgi:hypothetical protein